MTIVMKSRQARQSWRDLLDKVQTGDDVIIERNGKQVVVMISAEDYAEIQDKLDDMRASRRAANIYAAWKSNPAVAEPWESVRENLVKDGLIDG